MLLVRVLYFILMYIIIITTKNYLINIQPVSITIGTPLYKMNLFVSAGETLVLIVLIESWQHLQQKVLDVVAWQAVGEMV